MKYSDKFYQLVKLVKELQVTGVRTTHTGRAIDYLNTDKQMKCSGHGTFKFTNGLVLVKYWNNNSLIKEENKRKSCVCGYPQQPDVVLYHTPHFHRARMVPNQYY